MTGRRNGLDSHQIAGLVIVFAVLGGLAGLAVGRLDVIIMLLGLAVFVYLMTLPTRQRSVGDGAGSGVYDSDGDGGGCGGD